MLGKSKSDIMKNHTELREGIYKIIRWVPLLNEVEPDIICKNGIIIFTAVVENKPEILETDSAFTTL
jgi:hypothetical protein